MPTRRVLFERPPIKTAQWFTSYFANTTENCRSFPFDGECRSNQEMICACWQESRCSGMSQWLNDGEVLVGQGSGEAVPVSPRLRSLPTGSPRLGQRRSPLHAPRVREAVSLSPQAETMGKAKELFVLCDKEGKGFITKRDMQVGSCWLPVPTATVRPVLKALTSRFCLLLRGCRASCLCPTNSWRPCSKVWTERTMGSSLQWSSTQDSVSSLQQQNQHQAPVFKTCGSCVDLSVVKVS